MKNTYKILVGKRDKAGDLSKGVGKTLKHVVDKLDMKMIGFN